VVLSHHLATFDSTGDIANEFLSYALEGFDIFDLPDLINGIDTDYINSIINRSFKKENICVAIAAQSKED
jgi:predicted Zn-dependent peptidase